MRSNIVTILKDLMIGMIMILSVFITSAVAQDAAISVDPTYVFYADETPGEQSELVTITLTNEAYSSGVGIGSITLTGSHYSDFIIHSDGCSGKTLEEENDICDLQIKFAPQSTGKKNALITIPYGSGDTKLSVHLSNYEDKKHEAKRRLPPVIYDLNIPEEMNATQTYDLQWTAMGYHEGYKTMIMMFDCTDIPEGECGSSSTSSGKFHESDFLTPDSTTSSDWTYGSARAQNFYYTYSYTVPETRLNTTQWASTGTQILIRFYVKSTEDDVAGKPSNSLIVPGNLSNDYYDTSGRKIKKIICPSDGCTP